MLGPVQRRPRAGQHFAFATNRCLRITNNDQLAALRATTDDRL